MSVLLAILTEMGYEEVLMECITARSNKEYRMTVRPTVLADGGFLWRAVGYYGRIGASPNEAVKYEGTSLEKAQQQLLSVEHEKTKKGYLVVSRFKGGKTAKYATEIEPNAVAAIPHRDGFYEFLVKDTETKVKALSFGERLILADLAYSEQDGFSGAIRLLNENGPAMLLSCLTPEIVGLCQPAGNPSLVLDILGTLATKARQKRLDHLSA